MGNFKLKTKLKPRGDQPKAIKELTLALRGEERFHTLLGVTGSGKTFTLAHVINNINKPALVISHNKTLAAQLYSEFKELFPDNAVEYFVSYYDYYQPEAYVPATDTYIEKDSSINDRLDRLRLSATCSLMSRQDVIIVASVSCIYNLGSPRDYKESLVVVDEGQSINRDELILRFIDIQYERNDYEFIRGRIRVRGDVVEVFPAYKDKAVRIEFEGDVAARITEFEPVSAKPISRLSSVAVYPAKHFIVGEDSVAAAGKGILEELRLRLEELRSRGKLLEAQRLESRTRYDLEMLKEIGYCHGIENYSRHLSGRPAGSRPYCLIDYFPRGFITVIDESHVTLPQIAGMYEGDKARKDTLVEYGFRLPSCLDNRPLKYDEFEAITGKTVFVSATPAEKELKKSGSRVVEQIIRPTGLPDPRIIIRPTEGQIEDLIKEIRLRAERKERTLVTTLTKRMAEDLASYLQEKGINVRHLHSEIETIERSRILKELRLKKFDCLVGINLLREGLDLPEVSLVAILDADKEGFLRSATSLIQTSGRAARNLNGAVIMYADSVTKSMRKAIDESNRRREKQIRYNKSNKITPASVKKAVKDGIEDLYKAESVVLDSAGLAEEQNDLYEYISELQYQMELAARNLQFEKAAQLRDKIKELKIATGDRHR